MKEFKIDTWDHQWLFCILEHDGFCIVPYKNLIKNVGNYGVHFFGCDDKLNKKTYELSEIVHPKKVEAFKKVDDKIYTREFKIKKQSFIFKKQWVGNERIITILGIFKFKYSKNKG